MTDEKTKKTETSTTTKPTKSSITTSTDDKVSITTITMPDTVFESHKLVKAFPMNRADYNIYRKWELPADENGADEGYLVEYLDGGKPNVEGHSGYISWSPKAQFDAGYNEAATSISSEKSLGNTNISKAKDNVSDLVVFGNGDMWRLLSKASSQKEGWMKSTKAMQIEGVGCLVQVTTQQGDQVAEAIQFVPGVKIKQPSGEEKGCRLVKI